MSRKPIKDIITDIQDEEYWYLTMFESLDEEKRYAKQFRLNKNRTKHVPKVKSDLQPNQRRIKTGVVTVQGNLMIHESFVKFNLN